MNSDDLRQDRHGDARHRAAVLDVTLAMLEEVGYQRLRVEAVAARSGVRRTMLRRWWTTRPLLVAEALQRRVTAPHETPTGDLVTDVRGVVVRTAAFLADPVVADALAGLTADAVRDPVAAQRLAALLAPRRAVEASILLSAVGRGDLSPATNASMLLDLVFGTLLFRRALGVEPDDAAIDALVEHVLGDAASRVDGMPQDADDGYQVDGHELDGHELDGHELDGHELDGHEPDGHRVNGHAVDGQRNDGQRNDGQRADGHRVADSSLLFGTRAWTDPRPRTQTE